MGFSAFDAGQGQCWLRCVPLATPVTVCCLVSGPVLAVLRSAPTRSAAPLHSAPTPAGDRQFFFLNGRPVDLPKATKALNECYRALSSPAAAASKAMAVVDFRCGGGSREASSC